MNETPSVRITVDIGPVRVALTFAERVFLPLDREADILPSDRMAIGYFEYRERLHVVATEMNKGQFPFERMRTPASDVCTRSSARPNAARSRPRRTSASSYAQRQGSGAL